MKEKAKMNEGKHMEEKAKISAGKHMEDKAKIKESTRRKMTKQV